MYSLKESVFCCTLCVMPTSTEENNMGIFPKRWPEYMGGVLNDATEEAPNPSVNIIFHSVLPGAVSIKLNESSAKILQNSLGKNQLPQP